MAWRLAKSLATLRTEVRARYPGTTFWTIGDEDHQNGYSDHNPNSRGVVCAADILDDGGMDLDWFAEAVRTCGHPDLDYVIWRDQIADADRAWQDYGGAYHGHVHVSVGDGPDGRSTGGYDSTAPWGIEHTGGGSAPKPSRIARPTLRPNDNEPEVGKLQRNLNEGIDAGLLVDNHFGPATTAAVRELQRRAGLATDGIYGRDSAAALTTLLEDDMNLKDKLPVTRYANDTWGVKSLTVEKAIADGYVYDRNASDKANKIYEGQAVQTALLEQLLAGQSGLTEAQIAAAVADGVRQAMPTPEALAAAVAAAVDHDLDTAAVAEALREVLGSVDEAGE
jgi:hypothetical protein